MPTVPQYPWKTINDLFYFYLIYLRNRTLYDFDLRSLCLLMKVLLTVPQWIPYRTLLGHRITASWLQLAFRGSWFGLWSWSWSWFCKFSLSPWTENRERSTENLHRNTSFNGNSNSPANSQVAGVVARFASVWVWFGYGLAFGWLHWAKEIQLAGELK